MKFLCDVHIPYKLVKAINNVGYECIHINNILDKWFTKDKVISKYADENDFIIMSKDSDFRNNFFINNTPKKLLKINLGNISNEILINLISKNIDFIEQINKKYSSFLIEIDNENCTFITKL